MNKQTILFVTSREAREVDGVIDILRARGADVARWNICQFPEFSRLSWSDEHGLDIANSGSSAPRSGWIHPQPLFSVSRSLEGLAREVALAECSSFLQGVLLSLDCRWLNPPAALLSASRKIYQLQIATACGIRIPPSLFTNDPDSLWAFAAEHGHCVLKAVGSSYWRYLQAEHKTYTRRLSAYSNEIGTSLRFGPVIVQKEIKKALELRVIVIGERAFTVSFDRKSAHNKGLVDMRQLDFWKNRKLFAYTESWRGVEALSTNLVRCLGLRYGALDWLVDEELRPYFLECNPLGSFKWYEMCGANGISEAIAAELLGLAGQ